MKKNWRKKNTNVINQCEKKQATRKAYKKNEQSTAKKDILRKTNRQAEGTPNL